jgi:hypothetical protein
VSAADATISELAAAQRASMQMPTALPAKKVTELPLPFASTGGGRLKL